MKFLAFLLLSICLHLALYGLMELKSLQRHSEITVIEIGTSSGVPGAAEKIETKTPANIAKKISNQLPEKNLEKTSAENPNNQASSVSGAGQKGEGTGSENVQAPQVLKEAIAKYPKAAKMAGIEGVVEMRVTINTEGLVESAEVIRGPGYGLNEAALEAMKNFTFTPAFRQGEKVIAKIIYRYRFILGGS